MSVKILTAVLFSVYLELAHGNLFRNREVYSRFSVHKNAKQITNMSKTTTPVATTLNATRNFESDEALKILNAFYRTVKSEIKQNKNVTVSANCNDMQNLLYFESETFKMHFVLSDNN